MHPPVASCLHSLTGSHSPCRRRQKPCWSSGGGFKKPKTPQKPSESRWALGPGAGKSGALGRGCLRQSLVSACFLSDRGGVGWGQLGVQEVQLQGLQGALRQLQQETEQNCRRELQQMRGQLAGKLRGCGAHGEAWRLASPHHSLPRRTSCSHGQLASGLWGPPGTRQHLYPELPGFSERSPGTGQDRLLPPSHLLSGSLFTGLPLGSPCPRLLSTPRVSSALMETRGSGARVTVSCADWGDSGSLTWLPGATILLRSLSSIPGH